MTDSSDLANQLNEFINTERTYVKKLRTLKHDYADPLRSFARSKETAILAPYEAKVLFGNIDNLLPTNEAFLMDLEKMIAPNGTKTVGGIGDVSLKHFKELRGFEYYKQYYVKREEAQGIFEREVAKRSSSFEAFIDVRRIIPLLPINLVDCPIAHKILQCRRQEPYRAPRTPHGTCPTHTTVYTYVPEHDQANGPR